MVADVERRAAGADALDAVAVGVVGERRRRADVRHPVGRPSGVHPICPSNRERSITITKSRRPFVTNNQTWIIVSAKISIWEVEVRSNPNGAIA